MPGAMRNWGRCSEIDKVTLSDIMLENISFENILSVRVLELPLALGG